LQSFPDSESGKIEVKIKRVNQDLAIRVLESARTIAPESVQPSVSPKRAVSQHLLLSLGLIFLGILNSGFLAILLVLTANGSMAWLPAILLSVVFGPIILTQFICGIIHAFSGIEEVGHVGLVASMLPCTPCALIGIPLGIWGRTWLFRQSTLESAQPVGFGATTRIFLRDARNAQLVVAMETIGAAVAILGIGGYSLGLYPSQLLYRVVWQIESKGDFGALQKSMQSRLSASTGVIVASLGDERVQVRCWRFQESHIQNQLQMQRPPSVVVVGRASGGQPDPTLESYLGTRQPASADQSIDTEIVLQSDWVEKVQIEGGNSLAIEWSEAGWQRVNQLVGGVEGKATLGLATNRWIDGVSQISGPTPKRMVFRMRSDGGTSPKAVQAAIRGPDLPAVLEAIQ
jgi:hypothetical protein